MSSLAARLKSLLQQLLHRVKASPSRLTVLHSPSDASTDVVFAFGCTANRDWSWTTSSLDKAWRKTPFSAESRTARILHLNVTRLWRAGQMHRWKSSSMKMQGICWSLFYHTERVALCINDQLNLSALV
ncbi:hypothetical protein BDV33DRAFT_92374 [Aspergillus novoparasiticus]|uniref:Uncharacterized protein n=1 Tax=Aspergillus novoparasiticus TaxID=986946 RepID=A0A5N6E858_9EURO|nr:hypothetical protein BDV33DRAFT_92374 [Aspergillus novoparasiticus]